MKTHFTSQTCIEFMNILHGYELMRLPYVYEHKVRKKCVPRDGM